MVEMKEEGDNQNKVKIEERLKELIVNEKQLGEIIKELKEKKNICICVPIIPNITFPALELTYVAFLLKRYLDQNSPGKTKVLLYLMDTVDLLRPLLIKEPKVYDAKTNLYLFRMYVSSIARSIAGDPSFAKHIQFRCVSSRVKEIIDTPNFMLFEEEINQEVNRLLKPLFSWDNVPGSDTERLRKFLLDTLNISWVENAEIRKSSDDMILSLIHI